MKKTTEDCASSELPAGYTRVTEILTPYKDFDNILPDVLHQAAERGDKVHTTCELYALNMLIENPSEEVKPFFESFKLWYDEFVTETILTEERVSDPELFLTGQFDLLCRMKGSDDLVLVDYKTPALHEISWRLQMAAYAYLLRKIKGISVQRRISLRLNREGKPPTVVEYLQHEHDERLYLNQLEIYRCFYPLIK